MAGKNRQTHYWRRDLDDPYRALSDLKSELSKVEDYRLLGEYADLKEKGLRKQSLVKINEFVRKAEEFPDSKRRELVRLWCQEKVRQPGDNYLFDSHPLTNEIIVPTLEKWAEDEPRNPEPLKWIGLFYGSEHFFNALEKSLALNPDDDVVRITLVDGYLRTIDYSTHHLSESFYLGEPSEDLKMCKRIRACLDDVKNEKAKSSLADELSEYQQMIHDWLDYSNNKFSESFPEWCRGNGRTYKFMRWI